MFNLNYQIDKANKLISNKDQVSNYLDNNYQKLLKCLTENTNNYGVQT